MLRYVMVQGSWDAHGFVVITAEFQSEIYLLMTHPGFKEEAGILCCNPL